MRCRGRPPTWPRGTACYEGRRLSPPARGCGHDILAHMGLLIHYFAAPSDEDAVTVVEIGPGDRFPSAEGRRLLALQSPRARPLACLHPGHAAGFSARLTAPAAR
jgi:hypothetical protein